MSQQVFYSGSDSAQGSEDQLKQVWEETDGLDPDDFNSKTFFKLHGEFKAQTCPAGRGMSLKLVPNVLDNNGDGFLDETELEALFNKEVLCSCIWFRMMICVSVILTRIDVHVFTTCHSWKRSMTTPLKTMPSKWK